jgi:tetrahydromethanopterin S-methyltransferase subunit G
MFNGFMKPVTLELIYETLLIHSNRFNQIDKRFEDIDTKFTKMFKKLDNKIDEKFGILDKKIDRVDSKFDRKFEELYKHLDWMKEVIKIP